MDVKSQVLAALLESGEALSGERLARKLGVSRNAVWKAINGLREEGYTIDAGTNRGYVLKNSGDRLSVPAFQQVLDTGCFGRNIRIFDSVESTNDIAREMAEQGAPHGTLIAADCQTAGRGRFGRKFVSESGTGIYMSFIVRPTLPADRAVLLTSMTAVAVARAVERMADVDVQIKWVNDLYINQRKICGILSEANLDFESRTLRYAVIGIGINTARMTFPEELREIATSVGNECGCDISRIRLLAEICSCMEELYPQLETGEFMAESRKRSNVIGRKITVYRGNEVFSAEAVDIDDDGSLVVQNENGIQTVHSGEISIRFDRSED